MLITLRGPEYLPVLDQWTDDSRFASYVSILGEILNREDHVIRAPPALLDRFSRWPGLSRDQSLALARMAKEISTPTLPLDEITDSLVLTGPAGPVPDPEGPTRWHRCTWTWLQERRRLDATVLAAENARDARLYWWLARAWAARRLPASLAAEDEPKLECRGMGGQTAGQELGLLASKGDPVLCILDSDRNHPQAELGATAKAAFESLRDLQDDHLAHIEPLQARDVENILPLPLVKLAGRGTHWLAPMTRRGFFARPAVDPTLAYVDLGKDQCERRLLDTRDPRTKEYRSAALARIREADPSCPASASTCERLTAEQPPCGRPWADLRTSCIIVHSVGKSLLPRVLAVIEHECAQPDRSRFSRSVARWLAAMLPADDPAVLEPARLAWSWGLRLRPRVAARTSPEPG